jgi:hypothetical protein
MNTKDWLSILMDFISNEFDLAHLTESLFNSEQQTKRNSWSSEIRRRIIAGEESVELETEINNYLNWIAEIKLYD